jgi:hypothetical protein
MDSIGNPICYFCEHSAPRTFMNNYNEFCLCDTCDDLYSPVNFNSQEINACPVCYENKQLFKFTNCAHSICLECCKTIFFGTSTNQRPKSSNEVADELLPNWIYNDEKFDEYNVFEDIHFNITEKTYDQLITIRNNLISERPEWMNTEDFINYENALFRYYKECQKADEEWEQYNQTKTKGNSKCPLCRMHSKYTFN